MRFMQRWARFIQRRSEHSVSGGSEPKCWSSLAASLKSCRDLEQVKTIHDRAVESGEDGSLFVASSLVRAYARCGSIEHACWVFEGMRVRDTVSWNSLLFGYADNGEGKHVLDLFVLMQAEGCPPNALTFVAVLKAARVAKVQLESGLVIHRQAAAWGCDTDIYVASTLVDMYATSGCFTAARRVLDGMEAPNVVSWTSMIMGYAENGQGVVALELFASAGCEPDSRMLVAALRACIDLATREQFKPFEGKLAGLQRARAIHSQAARVLCDEDAFVANALIDLYAKCGSLAEAREVFERTPRRTPVSWTTLMLGYAGNGEGHRALQLLDRMKAVNEQPDAGTYVAALKACASLLSLEEGRKIHDEIRSHGLEKRDSKVASALVDFYGKCGSMEEAQQAFDSVEKQARDLVTWTALLAGYSRQGNTGYVLKLFQRLEQEEGVSANCVTFLCLLVACSHGCLVEAGIRYFTDMSLKHGLSPGIEHYHCLVDMLSRANRLDEAVSFVRSMPYEATVVTWSIVLGACRKWKNVRVGRVAFDRLVELDGSDANAYVVMAGIYGSLGMWREQSKVEGMRSASKAWKEEAGKSWWYNELTRTVHPFAAG